MTPRILSAPTISTVLVRLTGPVCWIVLNAHFHSSEKSNVLRFSCHVWYIPIRCIRIYKPSSSVKRINWQMRDGMNLWEMRPGWDRACSSSLISFSSLLWNHKTIDHMFTLGPVQFVCTLGVVCPVSVVCIKSATQSVLTALGRHTSSWWPWQPSRRGPAGGSGSRRSRVWGSAWCTWTGRGPGQWRSTQRQGGSGAWTWRPGCWRSWSPVDTPWSGATWGSPSMTTPAWGRP